MVELWEILVPTTTNEGKPIRTRQHREWDTRVMRHLKNNPGMTILTPTKGKWVSPDQRLFKDRMIPVRIACTKEQILEIADMTARFYDQEAVMTYKISSEVLFVKKYATQRPITMD